MENPTSERAEIEGLCHGSTTKRCMFVYMFASPEPTLIRVECMYIEGIFYHTCKMLCTDKVIEEDYALSRGTKMTYTLCVDLQN